MARDFYKKDGSYYYSDNNQKILNLEELRSAANSGGKEIDSPSSTTQQPTQQSGSTGTQEEEFTDQERQSIDTMNEWIENAELSVEEKALLKAFISNYEPSGQKVPNEAELNQMLSDAALSAEADLKPYYTKITGREVADLRQNMADIRDRTESYLAQEKVSYKNKLQQTKDSLRNRGFTFSGIAQRKLGSEGFTKTGVTGELEGQRKLDVESGLQSLQSEARRYGTAAERQLGTDRFGQEQFGGINVLGQTRSLMPQLTSGRPYEPGEIAGEWETELQRNKYQKALQKALGY